MENYLKQTNYHADFMSKLEPNALLLNLLPLLAKY